MPCRMVCLHFRRHAWLVDGTTFLSLAHITRRPVKHTAYARWTALLTDILNHFACLPVGVVTPVHVGIFRARARGHCFAFDHAMLT